MQLPSSQADGDTRQAVALATLSLLCVLACTDAAVTAPPGSVAAPPAPVIAPPDAPEVVALIAALREQCHEVQTPNTPPYGTTGTRTDFYCPADLAVPAGLESWLMGDHGQGCGGFLVKDAADGTRQGRRHCSVWGRASV